MCGKHFRGCIHSLVLGEEAANIARKILVISRSGCIQRNRRFAVCSFNFLPSIRAKCDKCWQCRLTTRDGDSLFVGAPIRIRYLTARFRAQPRPEFDQLYA